MSAVSHSLNATDLPVNVAVLPPVNRQEEHVIQVLDLLDLPPYFASVEDAQKIYEMMYPLIRQGQDVVLAFEGVDISGSAGLHIAIGQLYGVLSEEVILRHLRTTGLEPLDQGLLLDVCDTAKKYYSSRELYDQIWEEILSEDE